MSKKHERIHWTQRRPELLDQWNYTKNNIMPQMAKVTDTVWWLLEYDDPVLGHFVFEWEAKINNRVHGADCPYLKGNALWVGFNDFAAKCPELISQWHPHKNEGLLPNTVYYHSNTEVWWLLPYDDPITGKHFDYEWKAKISKRARGDKCPYLTGKKIWPGFNDLQSNWPDLAAQWHPTKNQKTPDAVTCRSGEVVWWLLPYDDPITGKHFDFEWDARIADRVQGDGCPFLTGKKVWSGFNDLATRFPFLICEWHPNKNEKTPYEVACFSHDKVWWLLPYDDPITGKHFDFEWEAAISARTTGQKCPFLSGHAVYPGFNDLATRNPELAAQWHPTLNGDVTPSSVACHSNDKAWWLYPYDDPITGKHFDFEWEAIINSRTKDSGCPFLTGNAVYPGFNDLASCYPELCKEYHVKNHKKPDKIFKHETQPKRWWKCPVCGHEWRTSVRLRAVEGTSCPKRCREKSMRYC